LTFIKKPYKMTQSFNIACETLGLPTNCTLEQAKQTYRRLVVQKHPDKVEEKYRAAATIEFQQIDTAFKTLKLLFERREEAARLDAEEAIQRAAEEDERHCAAQEAARRAAEEAACRAVEEAARRRAEEAARHRAEEAARHAAEEAAIRRRAEEAVRRAAEEAARRAEEVTRCKSAIEWAQKNVGFEENHVDAAKTTLESTKRLLSTTEQIVERRRRMYTSALNWAIRCPQEHKQRANVDVQTALKNLKDEDERLAKVISDIKKQTTDLENAETKLRAAKQAVVTATMALLKCE
jgi:curved DNA-binding protein CbpA